MPWQSLLTGRFGADASHPGIDAGLVWADATGFRDFRRPGDPDVQLVPVIVELAPGARASELADELDAFAGGDMPLAYRAAGRYCTARFSADYCRQVLAGAAGGTIARFELQLPVIPQRPGVMPPSAVGRPAAQPTCDEAHLIAVIDSGCAFAHRSLRDASDAGTRVLALWTQDAGPAFLVRGATVPPDGLGYGSQTTRRRLNAVMRMTAPVRGRVEEAACYAAVGYDAMRRRFHHGAAVVDLLAGPLPIESRVPPAQGAAPSWQSPPEAQDPARRADLVFVELPFDAVQDSSSAGLPRLLLDGLRYIVGCAGPKTRNIVVNISDGSSRGSHDGDSLFERAMMELVQEQRRAHPSRRLEIVLPAGNSFDEERHAQIDGLAAGASRTLTLRVPPGSEAPTYLLVRIPARHAGLGLRVVPPGTGAGDAPLLKAGEAEGWPSADRPQCGVVFPQPPKETAESPDRANMALIAIAPTATDGTSPSPVPAAPCGDWRIVVEQTAATPTTAAVHLYVARNQTNPGALPRGLQARFVDTDEGSPYDPHRHMRSAEDDPDPPVPALSPIRRRGTLNGLACAPAGQGVIVVGSRRFQDDGRSLYSADGPAAGGSPPRQKPDALRIGDTSRALRGINVAGQLSGAVVRVVGTSFAAPQEARQRFNDLASDAGPVEPVGPDGLQA